MPPSRIFSCSILLFVTASRASVKSDGTISLIHSKIRWRIIFSKLLALFSFNLAVGGCADAEETGRELERRAHLLQIEISAGDPSISDFLKDVRQTKSCNAARALAQTYALELTERKSIAFADLPPKLQVELDRIAVGEATPPFSDTKSVYVRVLFLCGLYRG